MLNNTEKILNLCNAINEGIFGKNYNLRILKPSDVTDKYLSWLEDKDVNKFLENRHQKHTLASLRHFVSEFDSKEKFFFGLYDSDNKEHIGNFNLHWNQAHNTVYYGYLIGDKNYWGSSAAQVGTHLLLKFSFEVLNARKVWGSIYLANIGAIMNVKKFGFIEEGRQSEQYLVENGFTDGVLYGLKYNQWLIQRLKYQQLYE